MDELQTLQLKKLKTQQSFLDSYRQEVQYTFSSNVVPLFHKDFADIIPEEEKQEYKKETSKPNKLVNDVFKKLSTKLHPDKKGGDKELFQRANKARQSNNISELLDLAREIEMSIEESEDMIPILKDKNTNIQQQIDGMEKSLAWQWYHMNKEERIKKDYLILYVRIIQKISSVSRSYSLFRSIQRSIFFHIRIIQIVFRSILVCRIYGHFIRSR